jgi:hypothetical protein
MDGLVNLTKNVSYSSMGPSESYSIGDQNMYRLLKDYIKYFGKISKKVYKK